MSSPCLCLDLVHKEVLMDQSILNGNYTAEFRWPHSEAILPPSGPVVPVGAWQRWLVTVVDEAVSLWPLCIVRELRSWHSQ